MPKHIVRDTLTRSKFHIIALDEEAGMITVNFEKDGWIEGFECRQEIPLRHFVNTLINGQLEIHPLKQTDSTS